MQLEEAFGGCYQERLSVREFNVSNENGLNYARTGLNIDALGDTCNTKWDELADERDMSMKANEWNQGLNSASLNGS